MNDRKKYNKMETVLHYINKNFVTVSDEDVKKANPVLKHVMETIINAMKKANPLFNVMYESVLYGGSFFDGLKVGKPEEFDIDLKLVLPKLVAPKLNLSNQPGFVTVHMTGWANFEKSSEFAKYKGLAAFKDEKDFLMVNKVLQWIESTANLAMNEIGKVGTKTHIPYNGKIAEVSLKKSGPAVTALIQYDDIYMDVDLVAVFKLTADMWPPSPFKRLPTECNGKKEFLIVPKTPKGDFDKKDRCWRMSFQEQEKVLIMGNNTCKPALRLIKKLRDTQNHNMISSYFIKTIFLHEIDKQDKQFWNAPLSYIFMHMLKTYRDYLSNYKIPYYWNKNNNLLQYIDKTTVDNFKNYLNRVIDSVDKKLEENPYIIGEYLCTLEECEQVKKVNFVFGKSKSNGQDSTQNSCITENSDVEALTLKLHSCSVDVVDGSNSKDTNQPNNNVVISMLTEIHKSINNLRLDMKTALSKISTLEQSVQDLKNDNDDFKTILKDIGITQKENSETDEKLENKETEEVSSNLANMLEKIDYLHKSVQDLKTENDLLKTGLRQFVLLE